MSSSPNDFQSNQVEENLVSLKIQDTLSKLNAIIQDHSAESQRKKDEKESFNLGK